MSQAELRMEVLDLLARGKITIDQAARLLGGAEEDTGAGETAPEQLKDDTAVIKKTTTVAEDAIAVEELPPAQRFSGVEPRWLRIRVDELDTGRGKVTVNIPFGMVKFGMGMARMFGGEKMSGDLAGWEGMLSQMGAGTLVDVEDAESNEHVRIFVE